MSNMNGRNRVKLYKEISLRDGEFCRNCGVLSAEKQLVIDHRDNDNGNNSMDNLQFLCRKCNYLKNPRGAGVPLDKCVKCSSPAQNINKEKEVLFRWYMFSVDQDMNYKKIIHRTAEHLNLSPVTTKRYLDKMCSEIGVFEKKAGIVNLKEDWEDLLSSRDIELIEKIQEQKKETKRFLEESSNE